MSRQQERDEESRRMDLLTEMSRLLGGGAAMSADALSAVVDLLQAGVHEEKIVAIVTELQRVASTKWRETEMNEYKLKSKRMNLFGQSNYPSSKRNKIVVCT